MLHIKLAFWLFALLSTGKMLHSDTETNYTAMCLIMMFQSTVNPMYESGPRRL